MQSTVQAVCLSARKGTRKQSVPRARLVTDWGLAGDAHAGKWHRQVSLLSRTQIDAFRARGAAVQDGDFGENLIVSGLEVQTLPCGTRLAVGAAVLEITQIGKQCHGECTIFRAMGECLMPRAGVFARVVRGGTVRVGDPVQVIKEENADG